MPLPEAPLLHPHPFFPFTASRASTYLIKYPLFFLCIGYSLYLPLYQFSLLNWRFSYLQLHTYYLLALYPYPRLLTARTILAQKSVACLLPPPLHKPP